MSLLGRLEDLSLTDIIQIVYLSRRTGVLEILNDAGRHTVLFRHGLVVNAASPDAPDLLTWLQKSALVSEAQAATLRQMAEEGLPIGSAALQASVFSKEQLADAIRDRITDVIGPLLPSRAGEFNFLLSEEIGPSEIEYDPEFVFREGGFPPQKILEIEGDKLKPLRGLEESMKAGKALLGREEPVEEAGPPLSEQPRAAFLRPRSGAGHFRVAGGLIEIESPESSYRNIVVFERDAVVRAAAKRAFGSRNMKIVQFGSVDSAREAVFDFFRTTAFFVTFLEVAGDSLALLQLIKRKNPRLPVVMIDSELDLRRRHDLLHAGADLYLTKPSAARLRPEIADEELNLFAEELVLFADRAFAQWDDTIGLDTAGGRRFYEEAQREQLERSFQILKQLISELSDPNDIHEVSATILRLAAEYLDRAVLFVVNDEDFAGLGGFGVTGGGVEMDESARRLRIPRSEPSILSEVADSGETHRGKIRRTPANLELIEALGGARPTEVVALPIMHGNRTLGILYGDNAEHRAPIDSMTGLEIFLIQAGYAFGNALSGMKK